MHSALQIRSDRVRRRLVVGLTLTSVAALLAGCAAPGSVSPSAADTPRSMSTDISRETTVVDIKLDATQVATLKPITDAFTKLHPNVTFKVTGEDFAALQQNAPKLMAGDNAPDLIALPTPGNTVKNGLVLNLDDYSSAYGWNKFPPSQLSQWRFDDKGARGRGSLYGMGIGFTLTGVYYNKDLAKKAGINGPPTTLQQFEQDLKAAKAAGVMPLLTSGKDGLIFFPYQSLWLGQGTARAATDWVFGLPNATIDTPEAATAAETLQTWAKEGYLASDVAATDAATAQAKFAAGNGMFFNSGNWLAAPLGQQMGDKVGFFLFPAASGKPYAAMSDPANFVIPAKAKDANAAAAFLNFTFTDEGRKLVVKQKGLLPGGPSDATPVQSSVPVVADTSRAFQQLNRENGIVPFMGNATASFFASTLTPQLQLLLAGRVSPKDFTKTLQSDYTTQLGR